MMHGQKNIKLYKKSSEE